MKSLSNIGRLSAVLVLMALTAAVSAEPGTAPGSVPATETGTETGTNPRDPAQGSAAAELATDRLQTREPERPVPPESGRIPGTSATELELDRPVVSETPAIVIPPEPVAPREPAASPLPVIEPVDPYLMRSEWLLLSESLEKADAERRLLSRFGLKLADRRNYAALGVVVSRFKTGEKLTPAASDALLQNILEAHPDLVLEFNRAFYPAASAADSAPELWGREATGWSDACAASLRGRLVLLDSKVNAGLAAFDDAALVVDDVTGEAPAHSHGTSIASIWLARGFGIAPNAEVHAINVFSVDDSEQLRTNTWYLLDGLNRALGVKPDVINLSFGGVESFILGRVLQGVSDQALLVAAAGNSGPGAAPVFPAANEGVIAVTAVDVAGQIYRRANRGDYIDVIAPGVDVWALNASGTGLYVTGTSFAAPWVSAYALLADDHELPVAKEGEPWRLSFDQKCSI